MELKQWIILALFSLDSVYSYYEYNCPPHLVCGNDGKTYNNECEFRMARMDDEDLEILFDGRCYDYKMMSAYTDYDGVQLKSHKIRGREGWRRGATLFHEGPLHGSVHEQNSAEKMTLNAKYSNPLDTVPNWDGKQLGWKSISKK